MKKVRYMISDAANMMQVESHVLRYWEEELELDVPRNEMGHRYYTEENMQHHDKCSCFQIIHNPFSFRNCLFGHLVAVLVKHQAVRNDVLESYRVEEHRGGSH